MTKNLCRSCLIGAWVLGGMGTLEAQVDPVQRELIQLGYNQALEGHSPLAMYAFYYANKPDFPSTNMTLRMAVAPTYLDSELAFRGILGPYTDLGLGLAGGGFADSYEEIRRGSFLPEESFTGHGAEGSVSLYHLFNPNQQIPLYAVLRGTAHFMTFVRDDQTDSAFRLPDDFENFTVRAGLRWGGREPTLYPALAMELSAWYEGTFRSKSQTYGFDDRRLNAHTHSFWAEALLAYTFTNLQQTFYLSLTAGTSLDADRFSAYRLGALLPLVSEFPLSLPGYYYQEISAEDFVLMGGNYVVPLDRAKRLCFTATAATAVVSYVPGLEQPGTWHTGLSGGLLYRTGSWKIMLGYGYGVDAIRSSGRGANSIGILMQFDMGHARQHLLNPEEPGRWRGLQRVFGLFGT